MADSADMDAVVNALPHNASLRRLVRAELGDLGQDDLLEHPSGDQHRAMLVAAIGECLRDNPDFGVALAAALRPAAVAVPHGCEPPPAADEVARRWVEMKEVRRRWPMIREAAVSQVAAAEGVTRRFRRTGPATGPYGTGAPGVLMFDADDVERVAVGLASGGVWVSPGQRTDTTEGRAAQRRERAVAVAIGLVVVTLLGLLCFGFVQGLRHPTPGNSNTDCGNCGWH